MSDALTQCRCLVVGSAPCVSRCAPATLALATVTSNQYQLLVKRATTIPWAVASVLEADQTWAALLAHGVLTP